MLKKTLLITNSIFIIFICWFLLFFILSSPFLFPNPLDVIISFFTMFNRVFLSNLGMTFLRVAVSFSFAFISGGVIGILAGRYQLFAAQVSPFISIIRTVPVISVIVIIFILFGFSLTPYIIGFMMIFPLVYQAFTDSIKNIDEAFIDMFLLDENKLVRLAIFCYFPLIRKAIFTVILQSVGIAIKVIVMAEYIINARSGLGRELRRTENNLLYNELFAITWFLILLSLSLELIVKQIDKKLD